jgi:hypothetical protein
VKAADVAVDNAPGDDGGPLRGELLFGARVSNSRAGVSSSQPLARMFFCSLVTVSSNAPRRGASHPDRSAPRLGLRFAVGTGHLCQIKF